MGFKSSYYPKLRISLKEKKKIKKNNNLLW